MEKISKLLIFAFLLITMAQACSSKRVAASTSLFTRMLPTNTSICYVTQCRNQTFMPSIGNGYIGTIVMSDEIHIAGVYNGPANVKAGRGWPVSYYEHTHMARIPSTLAIDFDLNISGERSFALDTYDGVYHQWFEGSGVSIQQRLFAHRKFKNIAVNEILVTSSVNVSIALRLNSGNESEDIGFGPMPSNGVGYKPYLTMSGATHEAELPTTPVTTVAVAWTPVPHTINVSGSDRTSSFRFLSAFATSIETRNPLEEAKRLWIEYSAVPSLFETHAQAWNSLWNNGSILCEGDLDLSQIIHSSSYYLLSSIREDWQFGLSPGGIPGGEEYLGHVFWDQDTWMFPALLMMYPDIAKTTLEYRFHRIKAAEKIAADRGYQGAMFPWESAVSGAEVCPGEVYGRNQIHITGDIAFAVKQYWMATNNLPWMKRYGGEIVYSAAKFWASRVEYDAAGDRYVINDVMPPDEYQYPVKNSLYTNVVAKMTLEFAVSMGKILNWSVPHKWLEIASKTFIPYDSKLDYHPEFEGFNISSDEANVKQADVILVGFPLMYDMPKSTRCNDLTMYANITDPEGPAMTHSMFTIGWLELDKTEEAKMAFKKNFLNIQEPFKVWTEVPGGRGASNFITAAGGFLQSVMFGYGGLRLRENGLDFSPRDLPDCSSFTMRGIKFLGSSLTISRRQGKVSVEMTSSGGKQMFLIEGGSQRPLLLGEVLPVESGAGRIMAACMSEHSQGDRCCCLPPTHKSLGAKVHHNVMTLFFGLLILFGVLCFLSGLG